IADAAVRDIEERVPSAAELSVENGCHRFEHRHVDLLGRAREDVRAEERPVGVDAYSPQAPVLRGLEGTEAAARGGLEHDLRAVVDLVQRELLAFRRVAELLRIALEHTHAR